MHVAAHDPSPVAVDRDGVPKELIDREAELFRKQALADGKPENIVDKIVEGRIKKYYSEVCLLEQDFVKDPDLSVQKLLATAADDAGSAISVTGFVRLRVGDASAE